LLEFILNLLFAIAKFISNKMKVTAYRLSANQYIFIKNYSLLCLPMEACGLLGERKDKNGNCKLKIFPTPNISKYKNQFKISKNDFLGVTKIAELEGYSIVGCFHSHPDNIALPSSRDISLSKKNPFKLWLIFSVKYNQANLFYMNHLPCKINFNIE